jgi:para-aminobenzoate synthetase component 1
LTLPPEIERWVLPAGPFFDRMNEWGAASVPFLFAIDYAARRPFAVPLRELDNSILLFSLPERTNAGRAAVERTKPLPFNRQPESFEDYEKKFARVQQHLHRGDSYLLNLTCRTPIELPVELRSLFFATEAEYKLWIADQMLVFSPECFVRIDEGRIYSYPMKGTIDASVPNAETRILADEKETAEHYTIVDLIRNDLSQVATRVRVDSFRHVSRIRTDRKELLQVSSTISGDLPPTWRAQLGDIFRVLLPAGSVTGAPKVKTCEIINDVEGYDRGYYTGVFGVFDGKSVDTGVMIRFIERASDGQLAFKSGGGITIHSDARSEYHEMIDKVYVPLL